LNVTAESEHAVSAYCGKFGDGNHESSYPNAPRTGNAYSAAVTDYEITDFGVIHEIAGGGSYGNLSMAVHIYDLGAWNFR
jgi:hypothetical protein